MTDRARRALFGKLAAGAALTWCADRTWSGPAKATLTPCINQLTTPKADFRTAMGAYGKAGFRAVELALDLVEPFLNRESAATARRVMNDSGLRPYSTCAECESLFLPRLLKGGEAAWDAFKRKLELSAELGSNHFVLCSPIFEEVKLEDYETAIAGLTRVGEVARQCDTVVGLEFICRAHFLGCVDTTARLLRRVNHPNVKLLIDTFHFHAGVSKLSDIEALKTGEVSWVHINDVPESVPRELLDDFDRVYVGEGVMPLPQILHAITRVYAGPVSFEVLRYGDDDPYAVAKRAFAGLSRLLASL